MTNIVRNLPVRPARPQLPGQGTAAPVQQDRPQAKVWLNFGILSQDGKFHAIPVGVAVDTMKFSDFGNSQNEDFINGIDASNAVLEALQTKGAAMAPGTTEIIALDETTGFAVQLRRVNEKREANPETRSAMVSDILAMMNRRNAASASE